MTITVSFQPNADGSFRVICGAPKFNGSTVAATVSQLFGVTPRRPIWNRPTRIGGTRPKDAGLIVTTSDGSEYYENLRAIFLFAHAARAGASGPDRRPASRTYHFSQDYAQWYAAGYWF
jgi:hypothetical protein